MSSLPSAGPGPTRLAWLSLWLPPITGMAGIFYLSSLSTVPGLGGMSDTWLHGAGYAGLSLTFVRAFARGEWRGVTRLAVFAAWLCATAYGATDEWHQMYTPGRTAELRDVRNDAVGAALALGVAWAWGRITSARQPSRAGRAGPR